MRIRLRRRTAGAAPSVIVFIENYLGVIMRVRERLITRDEPGACSGSDLTVNVKPRIGLKSANGAVGSAAEPAVYIELIAELGEYRLQPRNIRAVHKRARNVVERSRRNGIIGGVGACGRTASLSRKRYIAHYRQRAVDRAVFDIDARACNAARVALNRLYRIFRRKAVLIYDADMRRIVGGISLT